MIPKNLVSVESNWQKELATSFTDPEKLLKYLNLSTDKFAEDIKARRLFPMRVPVHFANLIQPGERNDPLLQQVFPSRNEFIEASGFSSDPLLEQNNQTPGLLHKYKSRVLLIVRGGCAVNCRYCFRRHFPYADNSPTKRDWQNILEELKGDSNINEVILSGGDPLMANDQTLEHITSIVSANPQIKRLRIHTRLPVVIPNRIDNAFLSWSSKLLLDKVMVLHINHANEISPELAGKVKKLKDIGFTLLNQAVLLKNINDTLKPQVDLNEKLFSCGVMPYYLHLLDKVRGSTHFEVPEADAIQLMHQMLDELPGFLVPKLVREEGGKSAKSPIDLGY
jgi:EF-P beta-lysylation protein EpmB